MLGYIDIFSNTGDIKQLRQWIKFDTNLKTVPLHIIQYLLISYAWITRLTLTKKTAVHKSRIYLNKHPFVNLLQLPNTNSRCIDFNRIAYQNDIYNQIPNYTNVDIFSQLMSNVISHTCCQFLNYRVCYCNSFMEPSQHLRSVHTHDFNPFPTHSILCILCESTKAK